MILGLILALASAVATNLACLFKQRGAVLAPPIRVRHPLPRAAVWAATPLAGPDGLPLPFASRPW